MIVTLTRVQSDDYATAGIFTLGDLYTKWYASIERPWKDNARGVSCIPAGEYQCVKRVSPKRGFEVVELLDVPGRTAIQIHPANWPTDLEGCIGIGRGWSVIGNRPGVHASRDAFAEFMTLTPKRFTLRVVDAR